MIHEIYAECVGYGTIRAKGFRHVALAMFHSSSPPEEGEEALMAAIEQDYISVSAAIRSVPNRLAEAGFTPPAPFAQAATDAAASLDSMAPKLTALRNPEATVQEARAAYAFQAGSVYADVSAFLDGFGVLIKEHEVANRKSRTQALSTAIGHVDDVSGAINLIAVNASIEAARLGDVGKGLSVIAAEIKNLSKRAKDGVAEIKGFID